MFPRTIAQLLSIAVLSSSYLVNPLAAASETLVFKKVNVISMDPDDRAKIRKRRTVVVEDSEIVAIGKAAKVAIPKGARVINAKKKYLLPGLFDMHAHGDDVDLIPEGVSPEELYSLYFANGITGVFDLRGASRGRRRDSLRRADPAATFG